jgi:hypothetical protein
VFYSFRTTCVGGQLGVHWDCLAGSLRFGVATVAPSVRPQQCCLLGHHLQQALYLAIQSAHDSPGAQCQPLQCCQRCPSLRRVSQEPLQFEGQLHCIGHFELRSAWASGSRQDSNAAQRLLVALIRHQRTAEAEKDAPRLGDMDIRLALRSCDALLNSAPAGWRVSRLVEVLEYRLCMSTGRAWLCS